MFIGCIFSVGIRGLSAVLIKDNRLMWIGLSDMDTGDRYDVSKAGEVDDTDVGEVDDADVRKRDGYDVGFVD